MESRAKFYNMTMVCDGDRVLVLDRAKNDWPGLTFPGGHVEVGESFADAAIREIFEETGLTVSHLIPCGVVHWAEKNGEHRCIEFLYRTSEFSGELSFGTSEGRCFFMTREELENADPARLSHNFHHYLPLFLKGGYSELFFEWDGVSWDGVPEYFRYEKE